MFAVLEFVAFAVTATCVVLGVLMACLGVFLLWTSKSTKANRAPGLVFVSAGPLIAAVFTTFFISYL